MKKIVFTLTSKELEQLCNFIICDENYNALKFIEEREK